MINIIRYNTSCRTVNSIRSLLVALSYPLAKKVLLDLYSI